MTAEDAGDASAGFSALQRAEIAEILDLVERNRLLIQGFSALQRAEIAEMELLHHPRPSRRWFQCSSTSRNC